MQQDDLNNWLSKRAAPLTPHGLAERIIHRALSQEEQKFGMHALWDEMLSMFALPHPSVALATCIILGLVVGAQAGDGLTILQQDWSSFLYINEGGWL